MSNLRAAFFDLDGTLKLHRDPYLFIHQRLGWGEKTQQFAAMYGLGQIDSDEWIRRDVALWRGLHRDFLTDLVRQIPYTPGAKDAIEELKRRGVLIAVVSTGLQIHANLIKADLQLDYAIANEVVFDGDIATGEVIIHVHEADKASIVRDLMEKKDISRDECLAIGDGEADVGMFAMCRIGIAIQPVSERVRRAAQIVLEEPDLGRLLATVCKLVPEWQCRTADRQEVGSLPASPGTE